MWAVGTIKEDYLGCVLPPVILLLYEITDKLEKDACKNKLSWIGLETASPRTLRLLRRQSCLKRLQTSERARHGVDVIQRHTHLKSTRAGEKIKTSMMRVGWRQSPKLPEMLSEAGWVLRRCERAFNDLAHMGKFCVARPPQCRPAIFTRANRRYTSNRAMSLCPAVDACRRSSDRSLGGSPCLLLQAPSRTLSEANRSTNIPCLY